MVVREPTPLEPLDITVSSNQGMVGSLSDDSTETFWESSQDDRNASISFSLSADASASLQAVASAKVKMHTNSVRLECATELSIRDQGT